MQWFITFPRKLVSLKNNLFRPEETFNGTDYDELLDLIKEAWDKAEEVEIRFEQIDPTPRYLYDNTGGEPAMSADERWQQAFNQKQELKS